MLKNSNVEVVWVTTSTLLFFVVFIIIIVVVVDVAFPHVISTDFYLGKDFSKDIAEQQQIVDKSEV